MSRPGETEADGFESFYLVRVSESEQVSALPDGGVVLLGPVPRGSGPELVVAGPDGQVRLRRDLHANGKKVTLTAASETTAFFQRGDSLFAHELATGAERRILKTSTGGTMAAAADAIGRRPAQDYVFDLCGIEVASSTGNAYLLAASLRRDADGCTKILALRWSPDGSKLAVAEENDRGRRVVVLRVADGQKLMELALTGTAEELGGEVRSDGRRAGVAGRPDSARGALSGRSRLSDGRALHRRRALTR
ncbi:hypothetical protein [Symbioplanes lichenis]|uniref:hypothetical protein n=1 Tax=Symbioplanes lichenis TaxID=1629072 RepID=UPI0027386225|nr:hypothetical protein [Actinoplanes lichenis]